MQNVMSTESKGVQMVWSLSLPAACCPTSLAGYFFLQPSNANQAEQWRTCLKLVLPGTGSFHPTPPCFAFLPKNYTQKDTKKGLQESCSSLRSVPLRINFTSFQN